MALPDYFRLLPTARQTEIAALLAQKAQRLTLNKKGIRRYRDLMESLAHLRARKVDVTGDVIRIGAADEISAAEHKKVHGVLREFMPWRKGPFEIFGIPVDAEWRSEKKWNRLVPALPPLTDKIIADIGSNNGYYMFRMAQQAPKLVLGFEPFLQHYYAFRTLNNLAGFDHLHTELLGVEHLELFPRCFDLIFLMGILYHHPSPIAMLRDVRQALKPGGTLIVESQVLPGDEPVALFPAERYAKVPGTYFVPTVGCLRNWLTRSGFREVECLFSHPMSSAEQRRTDWMVFESYADFIDPTDSSQTVEGYPAPHRACFKAIVHHPES